MKLPTPNEIRQQRKNDLMEEAEQICNTIIENIKKSPDLKIYVSGKMNLLIRPLVMEILTTSGWSIEFCSDQRDGDGYHVKPA